MISSTPPARFPFILGLALMLLNATAPAAIVLSNFYRPYAWDIGVGNSGASAPYVAQSFYTGPASLDLWRVDTVMLMMGAIRQNPDADFELAIYSDADNLPWQKIGTLTGPARPDGDMVEQTFTGPILLNPQTQYWIVASAPVSGANGAYQWGGNDYTSFWIDEPGWGTDPDHAIAYSFNGDSWGNFSIYDNGIGYLFFDIEAIEVQAIPEPGTVALLGIAGAGWFLRGRRRLPLETGGEIG